MGSGGAATAVARRLSLSQPVDGGGSQGRGKRGWGQGAEGRLPHLALLWRSAPACTRLPASGGEGPRRREKSMGPRQGGGIATAGAGHLGLRPRLCLPACDGGEGLEAEGRENEVGPRRRSGRMRAGAGTPMRHLVCGAYLAPRPALLAGFPIHASGRISCFLSFCLSWRLRPPTRLLAPQSPRPWVGKAPHLAKPLLPSPRA